MGQSESKVVRIESCPMNNNIKQDEPININPLNKMPLIPQQQKALNQQIVLPIQRTTSTIPRANSLNSSSCPIATTSTSSTSCPVAPSNNDQTLKKEEQWEYPSPQQFYNALVKKGWETPEESIETMVSIHNWMNEAAWQQVRTWEEKHTGLVILSIVN